MLVSMIIMIKDSVDFRERGSQGCIRTPTNVFGFKFSAMAVDTRKVFSPKSRPFTVVGSEYGVPPLQAPVDAKLTNVGTSVISNPNPPFIMSPMSVSKSASFVARSPICTS